MTTIISRFPGERGRLGRTRRRPADGIFHHQPPPVFHHPVAAVYDRRILLPIHDRRIPYREFSPPSVCFLKFGGRGIHNGDAQIR